MKHSFILRGLGFIIFSVVFHSCKKEELPALSTTSITNITATSASSGGNITSDGGAGVIARGICWDLNANPTTSDSKTTDGDGIGQFVSSITGITGGTTYHVRSYATNSVGTAYGADMTFSTLGQVPEAITQSATNISTTDASLNGTVKSNFLSTCVTFDYGTTTEYGNSFSASPSPITVNSITNVSANISGLSTGTTYHYTVKAVNSLGTTYGIDMTFTTLNIPTFSTTAISSITFNSALSGGNIFSDGGAIVTTRGVCWNTSANPTIANNKTSDGTGTGIFTSSITGLSEGVTYYVRAYVTNSIGTFYGNEETFTTISSIPSAGSQIIADHSIVDRFDDIPSQYIIEVKKMWLVVAGESHAAGYRYGLLDLETLYPTYAVSVVGSGIPEAYTDLNLRASGATWGDLNHETGWRYSYGEEDWVTSATAIARTKAGITYCNTNSLTIAAMGFGWCYDNFTFTDAYCSATQEYIDYCTANGYSTIVFFTTGPVDGYNGRNGYNNYLRWETIRGFVAADSTRMLFDYADILCYDDDGSTNSETWNGYTFPKITSSNALPTVSGHISAIGRIRLAKAMWWFLARIAGWDGD